MHAQALPTGLPHARFGVYSSTVVLEYKALPMRASAPTGRALCSFLQSTSSTEVESYRCVIQLANCATMQCADLWCGGKLLILYVNLPSILYSDYMLYSDHCMIGFLRLYRTRID